VNPLPKVFMKKEKIQLTVNSGVSKEVILQGTSHPLKEKGRQSEKLSFLHEAAVENWSTKDFTFTYTVSYPTPFLDYLYLFDISVYACALCLFVSPVSVAIQISKA